MPKGFPGTTSGMLILALDLGLRTGWAFGEAGKHPSSGSDKVRLVDMIKWLDEMLRGERPELVVTEAPLPLRAYRRLGTSELSVYDALKRAGIVEAMCGRWKIARREVDVLKVRKHFTGASSHGGREESKRAVIMRCRQLGYVAADETDDDRCDALAIWDWAGVRVAGKQPKVLHMFGGQ